GNDRRKAEDCGKSEARHLPRRLGDPDRAADLVGAHAAGENVAEIAERTADDVAGLADTLAHRLERRERLEAEIAPLGIGDDADLAKLDLVAELVGDLRPPRRDRQVDLTTCRFDGNGDSRFRANGDIAADIVEGAYPLAIESHRQIARLDTRGRSGTVGPNFGDDRIGNHFAVSDEQ